MERSCEYIEEAVADSRQEMALQLGGLGEVLTTPHRKKLWCYETAYKASDLDRFFGTTPATEKWYELLASQQGLCSMELVS
jgi:hypothetical protein